jgi:hypothetical protein
LLPFPAWGTGNVSFSFSPPDSLQRQPNFSLLKPYSFTTKLYCFFHWIFASCLNSPARHKNRVIFRTIFPLTLSRQVCCHLSHASSPFAHFLIKLLDICYWLLGVI